jgi:hypothetical protein
MPLTDRSLTADKLPNRYDSRDNLTGMLGIFLGRLGDDAQPDCCLKARNEFKLYFQALKVFNKANKYHVGGHNLRLFKTRRDTVLSNIRQLNIT